MIGKLRLQKRNDPNEDPEELKNNTLQIGIWGDWDSNNYEVFVFSFSES